MSRQQRSQSLQGEAPISAHISWKVMILSSLYFFLCPLSLEHTWFQFHFGAFFFIVTAMCTISCEFMHGSLCRRMATGSCCGCFDWRKLVCCRRRSTRTTSLHCARRSSSMLKMSASRCGILCRWWHMHSPQYSSSCGILFFGVCLQNDHTMWQLHSDRIGTSMQRLQCVKPFTTMIHHGSSAAFLKH